MPNILEGLLDEINRVKALISDYRDPVLGGTGDVAANLMQYDIHRAEAAIKSGDSVQIVTYLNALKSWT